jgi:hypothetical protein
MASNFSNYFFKAYTDTAHHDELVYGFNGTSGSQRMDGSSAAVGSIEFTTVSYVRNDLNGKGFSITGSFDASSFLHSLVKIDASALYTDGEYYISSSSEVWLRIGTGIIVSMSRAQLIGYLANVINAHRLDETYPGPPILATASGSFLILTQQYPGPTGNLCSVQEPGFGEGSMIASTTIETFAGGDGVGGGPYAISWAPTTGTQTATGTPIASSYVLSPVRHGNFSDVFFAPPDHYLYGPRQAPLVNSNFTGSLVISSNRDAHSRIFTRYTDGGTSSEYELTVDPTFTSLS